MNEVTKEDIAHLIRDKYAGDEHADIVKDIERLACGWPLAYVINWMPFRDLRIYLDSHPLIPRPETEWWVGELITHLTERFADTPFSFLDICAGSGAIGLSILKAFPKAHVSFGEIVPAHIEIIRKNLLENGLDTLRARVCQSDLFDAFDGARFDVIAANPPYVPESRTLPSEVTDFEPREALYAGAEGLSLIEKIAAKASEHIAPKGELWMECDVDNIERAQALLLAGGAQEAAIRTDQYGRPRVVVGYYA